MKSLRTPLASIALLGTLAAGPFPVLAFDDVFMTEFMAENDGTLLDEDGEKSDWIEIFNAGTNTVNLLDWCLTDTTSNPNNWWRFPATNLPPNGFLVVFASNKDRRIAGAPLHTNFRINNDGEYLALVKPDRVTIQSSYQPAIQVPDISYGIPVVLSTRTLVTTGAVARLTVPLNGNLGLDWTQLGFNDGAWANVTNGVGFEADAATGGSPAVVADSVTEFSGTQGQGGWFYGYWHKQADNNGIYEAADFTPFPRGTGTVLSDTNYWDGTRWDWPAGNPPWTELTAAGGHPNAESGTVGRPTHWAIRRYVSEVAGPLRITGTLACSSSGGTCGDGTIGHILVDGVEVFQRSVANLSAGYSIVVTANVGSLIDFVIDPGNGNNDACDTTTFTAVVRTTAGATVVADTIADWPGAGGQGYKNWSYGYFNRTLGGTYTPQKFTEFPFGTGPHSSGNFWNGESWVWFDGQPPFDTIGQIEVVPSIFTTGGTNGNEHWVIRRWVSEVSGSLQVDWHIGKKNLTGSGVIGTVYHNGTQRDTYSLGATDFVGTNRTTTIPGVQIGDFIDFAVTPGADIIGDLSFLNATIHGTGTLSNQFVSDVGSLMTNINASAYLRIPFTVTNVQSISALTLRIKNDDGFVAYLNGFRATSLNAPDPLDWNSAATASLPDVDGSQFQEISLDSVKDLLVNGNNLLAIQGLNASATDPDFLVAAELIATTVSLNTTERRYFAAPTPGSINGAGTTNIGPLITSAEHQPAEPLETQDLLVSAKISATRNPLGSVSLYYRIMYGSETSVPMADNGLNGDLLAGDGIYTAIIPNTAYSSGQMIRYYLAASDTVGNLSFLPTRGDTNNSSLYFGTVAQDLTLTNPLPVLHWFTQSTINSTTPARASVYWRGEFYDNIKMNVHGQSSQGFRNHSFNMDFNPDHHFKPDANLPRVDDINLLSTYADKAHMRLMLSYQIYADSGPNAPYHFCVPARMQSNGVFHSIMHIVENGDDNYLERLGRDPNGALYKMYTDPSLPANAEKKTRRFEDKSDFVALVSGINSATNRNYIYDNVDVSEAINFFAAMIVTASVDCCHKNFYLYRDSDGDGEWEMLPWDLDLSFGRNWQSVETYWDDRVYPNNGLFVGTTFPLGPFFFNNAVSRATYLRRVRTLQDQLLQTNGTPVANLNFENQIDHWASLLTADGALDLAKWGTWGGGNGGDGGSSGTRIDSPSSPYYRTLPQSVQELKTNYLVNRRNFAFVTKMGNAAEFPDAQPTNAVVLFGALDYNPASGNQNEEYVQLINTNAYAVDISGWKVAGAIEHTFQAGVVIPRAGSSNVLYLVANKKVFRNRAISPRGGQGLYIEGPYEGQLSARGETLFLTNAAGVLVQTNLYLGNPSGPQQYLRITEIMYHPPIRPVGSVLDTEEFEYIELKNTGPTNLNLTGVHFTNGIDFNFTGSAVTTLAPGAHVLVVKNQAAFSSRYGSSLNVAGQYSGILNNSGERIRLDDAFGEKILDFEYNNSWYPVTDGPGASLVIVNPNADWRSWDLKESWRPSAIDFGSPGQTDPAPASVQPLLVNEVLTRTILPQVDAIEILNTNATVANIGGWFLSDDFASPKKYRVPDGTTIPAGGNVVFYEDTSFGIGPNPFAISSTGDETYLFSGNGTNLTGYVHGYSFGGAETGVSFGRYVNSQTNVHFVAMKTLTLGTANATPKVGPVVISEINYRPRGVDNEIDEYVELANISAAPVQMFDPAGPANTWRLRGGVDFDFPQNITIPVGGHVVLVSFNPAYQSTLATFRARMGAPESVPVFGPFSGHLDNTGESLRLWRPDSTGVGGLAQILVDEVEYSNQLPWPAAADGIGPTLQRLLESAYGNDPTNWTAAPPSVGAAFVAGGTPPSITTAPASLTVAAGRPAMFSVGVAGTPPFLYQWRLNGTNLPDAYSSSLTLPNVQFNQAGSYSVVVINLGGSVESPAAQLTVLSPPSIAQQPVGKTVFIKPDTRAYNLPNGTNVTFSISASSANAPTVAYQWRLNGTNLPGEISSSITITNVQVKDEGDYVCSVTDPIDTVFSAPAHLTVWFGPIVVQASPTPTNFVTGSAFHTNFVPAGSPVTFAVSVIGNPASFSYYWRLSSSSTPLTPVITTSERTNVFTYMTSVTPTNFRVFGIVTNAIQTSASFGQQTVLYNITTLADNDHDGIPDSYEATLGLDTNNAADALGDLDLDGMSNKAEYLAGTDPNSNLSYLKVELDALPGAAAVEVAAVANRSYSVQYTDALGSGAWTKLADVFARATNRVETIADPNWTSNRFYRVVLPMQ